MHNKVLHLYLIHSIEFGPLDVEIFSQIGRSDSDQHII